MESMKVHLRQGIYSRSQYLSTLSPPWVSKFTHFFSPTHCTYLPETTLLNRSLLCTGVGIEDQRLMFGSKQLDDDVSLLEAGVSDESAMYVLLRLLGGAKKRKKKTYTKPKKLKHKHKKVKLAVLNFYKVQLLLSVTHQEVCK